MNGIYQIISKYPSSKLTFSLPGHFSSHSYEYLLFKWTWISLVFGCCNPWKTLGWATLSTPFLFELLYWVQNTLLLYSLQGVILVTGLDKKKQVYKQFLLSFFIYTFFLSRSLIWSPSTIFILSFSFIRLPTLPRFSI